MQYRLYALLVLALLSAGCDEELTPPDAIDAYYTLWGALDARSDRQAIRVIPFSNDRDPLEPVPLNATVASTNLQTGETVAWRDSVVTFPDGTVGHVFLGDFQPQYGASYRVDVERDDGATTSAHVRMPLLVEPFRQTTQFLTVGVYMPVLWQAAPQLNNIQVRYRLHGADCEPFDYLVPFEGEAEPYEFGWTTAVNLTQDVRRIKQELGNRPLSILRMTMLAEVASEDWRPPGGVFAPEVIIEPGTFSNVEHGFGLVGGAYRAELTWIPEANAVVRAGFEEPGFGGCGAFNSAPRDR